ncbi:hypothetical protein Pgy4_19739, partial [Pseudomonas savastanoi pv. glycinea str. race 4]
KNLIVPMRVGMPFMTLRVISLQTYRPFPLWIMPMPPVFA